MALENKLNITDSTELARIEEKSENGRICAAVFPSNG